MLDFEALREALQQAIPFNKHVGLEVAEVGEARGSVRLPDDARLHNHVGSQHAAGLFAAAEAASGAAFMGAFGDHLGGITPLARSAEIDYRKLARGPILASATLGGSVPDLLAELDREGRVQFPVEVELSDESGQVVATMTVHWHVQKSA